PDWSSPLATDTSCVDCLSVPFDVADVLLLELMTNVPIDPVSTEIVKLPLSAPVSSILLPPENTVFAVNVMCPVSVIFLAGLGPIQPLKVNAAPSVGAPPTVNGSAEVVSLEKQ